jgi:hypothetical protein
MYFNLRPSACKCYNLVNNMKATVHDILHGAVTRLLKPLARILLRHNVSFLTFSDLAKREFIEVAEELFSPQGRKQSVSRIAMLTGLSRKEVLRVKRLPHPDDDEAMTQQGRSTRTISGWTRDSRFLDAEGDPLPLHFDGEGSFCDLARRYSGDIPPSAVLDELFRVGLAERQADGCIRLIARGYIPRSGTSEKLSILGVEASDLLNTIDHNIHAEGEQPFLQRKVCYYNFPNRHLPELRELIRRRSQELLEEMNRWMAEHDEAGQGEEVKRTGLSIYYFEGPPEEDGGEDGHEHLKR